MFWIWSQLGVFSLAPRAQAGGWKLAAADEEPDTSCCRACSCQVPVTQRQVGAMGLAALSTAHHVALRPSLDLHRAPATSSLARAHVFIAKIALWSWVRQVPTALMGLDLASNSEHSKARNSCSFSSWLPWTAMLEQRGSTLVNICPPLQALCLRVLKLTSCLARA